MFIACYTNKYNPLNSKLNWRELKKIILDTQDKEAFKIHYKAFKQKESRGQWFPEAITVFENTLRDVDKDLYSIILKLSPKDINLTTISYACLLYDQIIVNACVRDWLKETSLDEYKTWSNYVIEICKEYCKGMLAKDQFNIMGLRSFIEDISLDLDIDSSELERQFTEDHLPVLVILYGDFDLPKTMHYSRDINLLFPKEINGQEYIEFILSSVEITRWLWNYVRINIIYLIALAMSIYVFMEKN